MISEIKLDCIGKKCPRPIIEIAKAARKLPDGSVISIMADDLAFESDVKAWAENAKAVIISVKKVGNTQHVKLKLSYR